MVLQRREDLHAFSKCKMGLVGTNKRLATHHFITKMERECHLATLNQLDTQVAWLSLHYAYVFGFFFKLNLFSCYLFVCVFVADDERNPGRNCSRNHKPAT